MARKFDPAKSYAFDLECTSLEPAHAYLGCFARLSKLKESLVKVTRSIDEIVDYIFSRGTGSRFYAHNLTYDISFILCHLFKKYKGEFSITKSIIQDLTKNIVTMDIKFRGKTMRFIDTVPIFSAPLADVLKAFTDMEKGETPLFDYIHQVKVTQDVIDYCVVDTLGLAKAIIKRMEYGEKSLTTASDAFKTFRSLMGKQKFERFYQPLAVELDDKMRSAYRGGFTFLNPAYKETTLKNVHVLDVNSMYPAQMYNKSLPYGEPKIVENGEVIIGTTYNLGIQKFSVKSAFIKDHKVPFISTSNSMLHSASYLAEISEHLPEEKRTFSLTLQEFELFKEYYDYEGLNLQGGFLFKSRKDLFRTYIDHFLTLKNDDNPTVKNIGKLFLNALYGKFAEAYTKNTYNVYYEDRVRFHIADSELRPCGYLPVGIFITSYARCFLLESIDKIGYENFVYCDTDSMHFINIDEHDLNLELHDSKLGAWKLENVFYEAYYIRAKRYCGSYFNKKIQQDDLKMACAGIKTKDLKRQILSVSDFRRGKSINTIEFKQGVNGKYVRPKIIKI